MTTRARRLAMSAVFAAVGVAVVIGAAVVGAASAPPALPADGGAIQPVVPDPEVGPGPNQGPVRRSAVGVIVGIQENRLAVRIKSQPEPITVAVRPRTLLRVNRQPATLEDFRVGDKVVVLGRPGPRPNVVVALGINVVRPGA